jgi:hypothetical protein
VLHIVLDWCKYHANGSKPISKSAHPVMIPWEERFLSKFDHFTIVEIEQTAEYMDIPYLLAVCHQFACNYDFGLFRHSELRLGGS